MDSNIYQCLPATCATPAEGLQMLAAALCLLQDGEADKKEVTATLKLFIAKVYVILSVFVYISQGGPKITV